jgi:hypothetical protein
LFVFAVPGVFKYCAAVHWVCGAQDSALTLALNVPAAHGSQPRSAMLDGSDETSSPAPQVLHAVHAVAGFASWSQLSVAQMDPAMAPPGQYQPTAQVSQVAGIVLVGGAVCRLPGPHCIASTHWAAFSMVEYLPWSQGAHCRSADVVPTAET